MAAQLAMVLCTYRFDLIAATSAATHRKRIGLAVFALPRVLYGTDLTVLNLAVPSLTADLQPMAAQPLCIVEIYISHR